MVDRAVAAAGVLGAKSQFIILPLCILRQRPKTYDNDQAPPATVFLQDLQVQIPTDSRLTESFPQKLHANPSVRHISLSTADRSLTVFGVL
jgi:hypothetical protein